MPRCYEGNLSKFYHFTNVKEKKRVKSIKSTFEHLVHVAVLKKLTAYKVMSGVQKSPVQEYED